jgi:outer membrane murein-binding lipoprotein Lpp
MKRIPNIIIHAAVVALAALLLAGCQNGSPPTQKVQEEHTEAQTDSLKEDSMKVFYERMERWEVLHGGMSRWESDK